MGKFQTRKNNLALFKALRKRNLKKDAQKQEQIIRKSSKKEIHRDADFYLLQYHLEQEAFELSSLRDRPTSANLQQLLENNTYFFIINKLRHACTLITHSNLFRSDTPYDIPLLEPILQQLSAGKYQSINAIGTNRF